MSGRRSYEELRARLSPEERAEAKQEAERLLAEMDLAGVRRALDLSQEELARRLGVGQPAVAKFEGRTDMLVSTLRRYVEAAGGELEITARFPGNDVVITNQNEVIARKAS